MFRENGSSKEQEAITDLDVSLRRTMKDGFLITSLCLTLPGLPANLSGFKMLQLSDFHFGPSTKAEHIAKAVCLAQELNPDLVLLTGDYLQLKSTGIYHLLAGKLSPRLFRWGQYRRKVRAETVKLSQLLNPMTPPEGCIGILGNHDYTEGAGTIRRKLRTDTQWLINDSCIVTREEAKILFSGIDDYRYGKPELAKTIASSQQQSDVKIFLAHNPDTLQLKGAEEIAAFDLVLGGHTHGGQICLPGSRPIITRTKQKRHVQGLSWFGRTPVYVSNGIGYGGIALRLFCPPELVVITLRSSSS